MTHLFQKIAYAQGVAAARAKLGTAAGAIDYAPREAASDTSAEVQSAFDANTGIDKGFGPESAMTQPHGGLKAAAAMGMGSMGAAGPASAMGIGGGLKGMGSMRSARGMMGLNSVPKPGASAAGMAMKSPMQGNAQQQLGAGAIAADAANSFGFNHRRIVGNPL